MQLNYTKVEQCTIESLGVVELDVYDIEVEDNHNFFANSILVHNSVYLDCQPLVDKICVGKSKEFTVKFLDTFGKTECQKVIDSSIDFIFDKTNAMQKVMGSKREVIASKALFRGKKNYALYIHDSEGVKYDPPKIKVLGIEVVRSSSPQWCRSRLKDGIKIMFENDELYMRDWFKKASEEFLKLKVEEISSPKGVSDIDKWVTSSGYKKGCPMHVRASILYNTNVTNLKEYRKLFNGDKIKYVYLKLPNPINENIIGFPTSERLPKEFNLDNYIDYDLQFEKVFRNPLESLTSLAGWSLEEKSSLEEFF